MSKVQPLVLAGAEATRGMEQELTDALIGCMREKTTDENAAISSRPAEIMSRFEDILRNYPHRAPSITDICAALDVPDRMFRAHCKTHLGIGLHRYLHLRQMQLARCALRGTDPGAARISDVAHRYGFVAQGRFAAAYHKQFGELPSDTMQRRASR
jgi:AraC-like DNA-binding protein